MLFVSFTGLGNQSYLELMRCKINKGIFDATGR